MRITLLAQGLRRLRQRLILDYPSRTRLALAVIAVACSISSIAQFAKSCDGFKLNAVGRDRVTLHEKRFADLKDELNALNNTAEASLVVGYASDADPFNMEFYLTQYALAPVVVDLEHSHALVVGNFADPASDQRNPTTMNMVLLRDFGNGVKLFGAESK